MLAPQELDRLLRQRIYEITLERGRPPLMEELAASLTAPLADIEAAAHRLADAHMLVLQPQGVEILMVSPFSAVPTPFLVHVGGLSCYGNCIWDAMGIAAILRKDASIQTTCPDCDAAMELSVVDGAVQPAAAIVHFALPARRWWDNIVFT